MPSIFDKNEFIQIYKKLLDYSKVAKNSSLSGDTKELCDEIVEDLKSIKTNVKLDEKSLKGGVYPYSMLVTEYQNYLEGKDSIIVASQHFDFGDESLSMDITEYVLDVIKSGENHGLCLAFAPNFENKVDDFEQYVGFVDDNILTSLVWASAFELCS